VVKIRLQRTGAKKKPSYRIVVADCRSPRDGRFIEIVGHYYPISADKSFDVDEEKTLGWLKKGAQPTETVNRLLKKAGIYQEKD